MTFTATYIAEENCLQELPDRERPNINDFIDSVWCPTGNCRAYHEEMAAYEKELAKCRRIPCDPSCKGLWADGQKVVEGKDYKLKFQFLFSKEPEKWITCDQPFYRNMDVPERPIAFPLVPVKSDIQDRTFTFHETLDLIADFGRHVLRAKNDKWDMANDAAEWLNDQLKKYSLTKR